MNISLLSIFSRLVFLIALVASPLCSAQIFNPPDGAWLAGLYPKTALKKFDYLGIKNVAGQLGLTRKYIVYVPASYDPATPTPLLFCFHGSSQLTQMFCITGSNVKHSDEVSIFPSEAGFQRISDEKNVILVMIQGFSNSWNSGDCCGLAQLFNLNDVALVRAIFLEIQQHLNVDRSRVYAVGFSNGAFFANRLACEASDIFVGIVSGSGGIHLNPLKKCAPSNNVNVLEIHGTWDFSVAYFDAKKSVAYWAKKNGCSVTSSNASFLFNKEGDTQCISYEGCNENGHVTFCTVERGGHCWFGSFSCGTGLGAMGSELSLMFGKNSDSMVNTDAVWPFLSQFSR